MMLNKFEEGKMYVKYANGYKVIYRITKRTSRKIYFYSIAVETDQPISKFDTSLSCSSGVIDDIANLFKEKSVNIEYAQNSDNDNEYFTIWNNAVGPIGISCLNKI